MKPLSVLITGLMYRRPGLNKIGFIADYGKFKRRGTIVYDAVNSKFLSHTYDIELLAQICVMLSNNSTTAR
jgi:hypothetical protein